MTVPTGPKPGMMDTIASMLQGGGKGISDQLTDLMGTIDPKLDHFRKSVGEQLAGFSTELKGTPEFKNLGVNTLPAMWEASSETLLKDFRENNMSEDEIAKAMEKVKGAWDMEIIALVQNASSESPEKGKVDTFITKMETFPAIAAAITAGGENPQFKITAKITEMYNGASDSIKMVVDMLFGGIEGILGDGALMVAGMLPAGNAARKTLEKYAANQKKKVAEKAKAGESAEETTQVAELTEAQEAAIVKSLEERGFKMDKAKLEKDFAFLKNKNINASDLAALSAAAGSNLHKINNAIKSHIGDGKVSYTLRDIYLFDGNQLDTNQVAAISEAINGLKKDPVSIRQFLDNAQKIEKGDSQDKMIATLNINSLKADGSKTKDAELEDNKKTT